MSTETCPGCIFCDYVAYYRDFAARLQRYGYEHKNLSELPIS
jgi:hypothetical protein